MAPILFSRGLELSRDDRNWLHHPSVESGSPSTTFKTRSLARTILDQPLEVDAARIYSAGKNSQKAAPNLNNLCTFSRVGNHDKEFGFHSIGHRESARRRCTHNGYACFSSDK